jgi:tetratricopeptide (TPR) repeat protein
MIVTGTIIKSPNVVVDYFHNPLSAPGVVAITFTPSGNRTLEGMGFGGKFLIDNKIDLVAVKCNNDSWFQSIPDESFDLINKILELKGYKTIVAYGSSMGGYAAVQFSKRFNCDIVLALSPQYSILEEFDKRWESYSKKVDWRYAISSDDISENCKYVVVYDTHDLDKEHADRLKSLAKNDNFHGVELPFSGHPVSHFLQESGILKDVALSVFRGQFFEEKNLRANKRKSKSYLKNLSTHLHKKNKPRLSLSVINMAIELDSEAPTYFVHKSTLLEGMGNIPESIQALARASELDSNPLIKLRISKLLVSEKRFAEALQYIDAGIKQSGKLAVLHRQKSEILVGLGDLDSAIESAHAASALDARNPFYRIHLSNLYSKQGKYSEAIAQVDEGLVHSPSVAALYRNKVELLKKVGDSNAANLVLQAPEYAAAK